MFSVDFLLHREMRACDGVRKDCAKVSSEVSLFETDLKKPSEAEGRSRMGWWERRGGQFIWSDEILDLEYGT